MIYEIINLNINDITNLTAEEDILSTVTNKNAYCCGLRTIAKLINYNSYPQTKEIAIKKILSFLMYLDSVKQTTFTLSTQILKQYFHERNYKQYINLLKDFNIMARIPHDNGTWYVKGETSCRYTLMNEYKDDTDIAIVLFKKRSGKVEVDTDGKYPAKYINTLKNITINYRGAIQAEVNHYLIKNKTVYSLKMRINNILSLNETRFIKSGNKVDRVYTSLSNISKVARPFLSLKGESFTGVDVKNAQPLLLCAYLTKENIQVDAQYIQDCENGQIYERFYGVIGTFFTYSKNEGKLIKKGTFKDFAYNDETAADIRNDIKKELFSSIYFDFKKDNPVNNRFKDLYPKVWNACNDIKDKEAVSGTLASMLQNLEASIINPIIPAKSRGYFTLFDGIYMTATEDLFIVQEQIKETFGAYGLQAKIQIEY